MDTKCLIVDDDLTIAENTAEYFNMFDVPTSFVTSYENAVAFLDKNEVSLILLDINLGDESGFELCKKIRENYDMPIIFISARKSDENALIALNIGGDDYISKPFSLNILLAKVKAVLLRYEKAKQAIVEARAQNKADLLKDASLENEVKSQGGIYGELQDGRIQITPDLVLDTYAHKLLRNGENIALKVMEYKMLKFLLEHRGSVVTKDELLTNVWEDEYIGEGTLAVHARHLREKIENDPKNPEVIKTIWGVGYIVE